MNVLVISVHPDDETLGCGGTLLKHKRNGDTINWLIITDVSESLGYSPEKVKERQEEIKKIEKAYGFERTYNLQFQTTKLHSIDFSKLIEGISKVIYELRPELVYMINRSDIHSDHQIAAKAIISCTKSFRYPFIKKILMYECISETEIAPYFPENIFLPNVYSDISEYIDEKIKIMKIYKSEVQDAPMPRSIENIKALARYRGSTVGVNFAEAFMLVREQF